MKASERIKGGLFGLTVGDALGVPVEFTSREERQTYPVTTMKGNGTHRQPAGTWSDDSSLALCLAASLAEKGYDVQDQAERFFRWYTEGYMTPHGKVFDVGNATAGALARFGHGAAPVEAGGRSERDNGNGGLMRILPAAFYFAREPEEALYARVKEMVSVTHGHWVSVLSCYIYILIVQNLYRGLSAEKSLFAASSAVSTLFAKGALTGVPEDGLTRFSDVLNGSFAGFEERDIRSGGYVLDTLTAALWCFFTTDTYNDCVLKAVNLGDDTDTTAAVAGGLAGTFYGKNAIPEEWVDALARGAYLAELIGSFVKVCEKLDAPPAPSSAWA